MQTSIVQKIIEKQPKKGKGGSKCRGGFTVAQIDIALQIQVDKKTRKGIQDGQGCQVLRK